jgi:L,D-transpeptidase-like protein/carboxypeptidase family protein
VVLRRFLTVVLATGVVLSLAPAAGASHATLTLVASASEIRFGENVTVSGTLTSDDGSPLPGETVQVIDADGGPVGSDITEADGAFSLNFSPQANVTVHAEWQDPDQPDHTVTSPEAIVGVRVVVSANISDVRLFGRALVKGRVRPPHRGQQVTVELIHSNRVVATKHPAQGSDGTFAVRFDIRRVGTYQARAAFDDADHLPGSDRSGKRATPLPYLRSGSSSLFVLLLERRLRELRYRVPDPDRRFDFRTADAVLAFNKVQGRPRLRSVGPSTWRALVAPKRPRARSKAAGLHVEVDKTKQVLYMVRNGVVTTIVHVSTGRYEGWTRNGVFRVYRKLAGYSGGRLYYPSYFDGLRAIHGWPEVPPYPASHGCVRVPMWTSRFLFDRIPRGTVVRIYRS